MRRPLPFVLGVILTSGALVQSTSARADDDPAAVQDPKQQFALGREAYAAKRYAEAALHFEAAAANRPHAVTLYTAGLAWDQASRPERAADVFARSIDVPGLDPKQLKTAKDRLGELERSLGTLIVQGPENTRVQLDNFTEIRVPARLHGAPGVHTLTIRAEGKPIERRDISLEGGQTQKLGLEAAAAKEVPKEVEAPPPPPRERIVEKVVEKEILSVRKAGAFGLFGLSAATFISGIVLGVEANGAADAYNKGPTRESYDHAGSLSTWCTVSFVFTGLFAAGGAGLLFYPDIIGKPAKGETRVKAPASQGPQLLFGPTGASLQGAF